MLLPGVGSLKYKIGVFCNAIRFISTFVKNDELIQTLKGTQTDRERERERERGNMVI
jgi:hypothetical protein